MNTKGIKFLAVLAVLAMAFAAFAVLTDSQNNDADDPVYVAQIGTDKYETLAKAIDAANTSTDANTIVIIKSCDLDVAKSLDAKDTLQIPAGMQVTITAGALTVAGTVENSGKLTVNANNGLVVSGEKAKITGPVDKSAIINGSGVPLISAVDGTIENQTIKAPASMSETSGYVLESSTSTKALTIQNNIFDLSAAKLIRGMAIAGASAADIKVLNNGVKGFVSGGEEKVRVLAIYSASDNDTKFTFTGNGSAGVVYDTALLNIGGTADGTLNIVTTAPATGGFVMIDSSFGRLSIANPQLVFNSKVTIEQLYIRANFGIVSTGDVTVTKKMFTATNDKVTEYAVSVAGRLAISQGATFATDGEDIQIPLYKSGTTLAVTVTGSIVNDGTIKNGAGSTFTGTGTISGSGVFENYGTLTVADGTTHKVYCTVDLYGGSTWGAGAFTYAANTGAALINFGDAAPATKLYVKHTQTMSSNAITSATYDIVNSVTLVDKDWIKSNTYTETITIKEGAELTLPAGETYIGAYATVSLESDAKFVGTSANTIKVAGTLEYSDATQAYGFATVVDSTHGSIVIPGSGSSDEDVIVDPAVVDGSSIDASTFSGDYAKADVLVVNANIKDAAVPANKTVVVNGTPNGKLDVSAAGSQIVVNTGLGTASFTVDTGAGKLTATGLTGTFVFTKGSVVVEAKDWSGGSIVLEDGDVLKMDGNVTGDVSISVAAGKKATIIIEADAELVIADDASLTVSDGITVEVYGKLLAETLGTGTDGIIDVAKAMNIYSGAFVDVTIVDTAATPVAAFTVYSGSNINMANVDDVVLQITGKDENGGYWTYGKEAANTLYLNNYNGTYNFGAAAFNGMVSILLEGDSVVTYTFSDKFTEKNMIFFGYGGALKNVTTASSGSLSINIDMSKIKKTEIFDTNTLTVIKMVANELNLNGVGLSITVSGENADWTAAETKTMNIIGINATAGFKTFNADLVMDVMSAYTCNADAGNSLKMCRIIALKVTGDVDIDDAEMFSLKAGGAALDATGKVEITGSGLVYFEGKKAGLIVATDPAPVPPATTGVRVAANMTVKTTSSVTIKGGMTIADLTAMKSVISAAGTVSVKAITESDSASVSFTGTATIDGAVSTTQESTLNLKNATINGNVTNGGSLNVTGDVVVSTGKTVTNNSIVNISGVLGIYGTFVNNAILNNEGVFDVVKYGYETAEAKALTITDVAPTSAGNGRITSISLDAGADKVTFNADGSAKVKATVTILPSAGAAFTVPFNGVLTPGLDGNYTLKLDNGTSTTTASATISLTYVIATPADSKIGGKQYTLAPTGTVKNGDDVWYLATNSATAVVATDKIAYNGTDGKIKASGATFTTGNNSVINNEASFVISSGAPDIKGQFIGNLVTNTVNTTITGTVNGNILASGNGTFTVSKDGKIVGDVRTKADVVVAGAVGGNIATEKGLTATGGIIGNIAAKDNVTVTDLLGDITINANGPKEVTVKGAMGGSIIYVSKYKATATATEPTEYTAKMGVLGTTTGTGFTVLLAAGSDATSTKDVEPGYFKLSSTMAELATGKSVNLYLNEGRLLVDNMVKLKPGYYLNIEAGTTIEVNRSAATLDVSEAALKVSKDATAKFETGSGTPVEYGKVLYIMSFTIDDGAYTIYSDVAYALSNCNEGSELTVGSNAPINTSVSVPAGVNIIVKDVTLTFSGMDVKMGEGAKITLQGTGKLVFNTSKDNTAIVKADEDYEYYSVTACIMYGDNELDFMGVRFNADNNIIVGKEATETAVAMIDVDLKYNEGTAMITEGAATGDLKLANVEYFPTKAAETAGEKKLAAAVFAVAEDATFDLESFTDAKMDAKMTAGEIEVLKRPTTLAIAGSLEVCANITVNGVVLGAGSIGLDDDKTITLAYGKILDAEKEIYFAPSFTGTIFDKRLNGFELMAIEALPEGAAAGATFAITADKTNECITFAGKLFSGSIEAVSDSSTAMLNGVTIYEDAILEAPKAIISGANVSNGLFKNIEMTKKTGATLDYGATYAEGDYTVYTVVTSIDFDEVSDITLTKDFDLAAIDAAKVDLSGKDVNITIAEGKVLIVSKILIMGTPITVLGDDEGSSIVGKVIITDKNYLIAYSDVDLTLAEFEGLDTVPAPDVKKDIVASKLDVDDVPYAAIFAVDLDENTVKLSKADASIIPEIKGYNFTAWLNYNGDANAKIGETNAYADAKATYVTVMVKYVAGVDYYMNGKLFDALNVYTDVPYGSYFTAKISDTSKYQGNPLVNGEKTVYVIEDTELVASGVTPIPEPEPEPVIGDSGLSLTDILLIVLVVLIAIMVVILVLRLNRS